MNSFNPPFGLRNPHIQSILSSTGPRKVIMRLRARQLRQQSQEIILDCGNDVRLIGDYSPNIYNHTYPHAESHDSNTKKTKPRGLAILIHGWEGSSDSMYMVSCAAYLYKKGFSVFRLNMRDHGNSHHLNRELFHSMRLQEVLNAVKAITEQFPHEKNFLSGFSLGGNFALRIAAKAPSHQLSLNKVVAICPVVDPVHTMRALNEGLFIYHDYFVRKWKRSLLKKLQVFPEFAYGDDMLQQKTLDTMNQYFIPFTGYTTEADYFNAYGIKGDALASLSIDSHIITSADDPVVPVSDFTLIANSQALTIEISQYGGHCAFLDGYGLNSWAEKRMEQLFI